MGYSSTFPIEDICWLKGDYSHHLMMAFIAKLRLRSVIILVAGLLMRLADVSDGTYSTTVLYCTKPDKPQLS